MSNNTKALKIVITGPENSGKSSLSKILSNSLGWPLVPELARSYLKGRQSYDLSDLRKICDMQSRRERATENNQTAGLICDTNALTIHIWAWLKFGEANICDTGTSLQPDLYVLCYPDVPYEADVQREDTGRTKMLFDLYLLTLMRRQLPFTVVRGPLEDRLRHTLELIKTL